MAKKPFVGLSLFVTHPRSAFGASPPKPLTLAPLYFCITHAADRPAPQHPLSGDGRLRNSAAAAPLAATSNNISLLLSFTPDDVPKYICHNSTNHTILFLPSPLLRIRNQLWGIISSFLKNAISSLAGLIEQSSICSVAVLGGRLIPLSASPYWLRVMAIDLLGWIPPAHNAGSVGFPAAAAVPPGRYARYPSFSCRRTAPLAYSFANASFMIVQSYLRTQNRYYQCSFFLPAFSCPNLLIIKTIPFGLPN